MTLGVRLARCFRRAARVVEKGVSLGGGAGHDREEADVAKVTFAWCCLKGQFAGRSRGSPTVVDQRSSEHVVKIQMQLAENADPAAAFAVMGITASKPTWK